MKKAENAWCVKLFQMATVANTQITVQDKGDRE